MMTTNPYSKGLDDVAKSIWHEPGEKPTRLDKIYFLFDSSIDHQNLDDLARDLRYRNIPWCYESDLARMLHDMRKAEKEPAREKSDDLFFRNRKDCSCGAPNSFVILSGHDGFTWLHCKGCGKTTAGWNSIARTVAHWNQLVSESSHAGNAKSKEPEKPTESKPSTKAEWFALESIKFDKDGTPKVNVKKCILEYVDDKLKYSEVETVNEPKPPLDPNLPNLKHIPPLPSKLASFMRYDKDMGLVDDQAPDHVVSPQAKTAALNERQKEKELAKSPSLDAFTGHVIIPGQNVTVTGEAKPATGSVEQTLEDRKNTHGDFCNHASITQDLKLLLRTHHNWLRLTSSMQEALDMITHKIGRVLTGNPYHGDHWHDIAGYAMLVERQIKEKAKTAG